MPSHPATQEDYFEHLDRMPKLYSLNPKERVPILRRVMRWIVNMVRSIR